MALTMDAVKSFNQRAVLHVFSKIVERGASLPFDPTYVPADTYGNKFLYPGMIVGKSANKEMYVPWSATASYGAYSAYACGIVDQLFDSTFEPQVIAPVVHGIAYKPYCYIYGGALGAVPDAVIQATGYNFEMRLIQWQE